MNQKTIHCPLITPEATLKEIWQLTAERNTPLTNTLIDQIAADSSFQEWHEQGSVPQAAVKTLQQRLKADDRFAGQSGRFYTSAQTATSRMFKSWMRRRQQLTKQLEKKQDWLEILQPDADLIKAAACDMETLQTKAAEILAQLAVPAETDGKKERGNTGCQPGQKRQKSDTRTRTSPQKRLTSQPDQFPKSPFTLLFEQYHNTEDPLTRAAIAYLLKNGAQLPQAAENPKKLAQRRRKTEIRIERLTNILARMHLPRGRDLTGQQWRDTLAIATATAPKDEEEFAQWQTILLSEDSILPFPITYETNEDLTWSLNEQGRICVRFNGLGEHTFELACDRRQLHWFQRFLQDQEVKKASKKQHSTALFTLRSAQLAWRAGEGEGDPWTVHRLVLFCTVETRLWSAEGTEQVRQEKAADCAKVIASTKAKGKLTQQQEAFIQKREKMLALINNPFPRPSRPLYTGHPSLIAGVSYGLDRPATLAIVDVSTGKAITYRSIRQLLGEHYGLLTRYRQKQQRNSHRRRNQQRKSTSNRIQESNAGAHLDCLIAKAIITVAQEYQVSSLVLPDMGDIREIIEAEVQARAEQKIVGYLEGQQQYAKAYRATVHRWSYSRLSQKIQSQAAQVGIAVEQAKQPLQGTPQEKAKTVAMIAYSDRKA